MTVVETGEGFGLERDGEPYFVEGARTLGTRYVAEVAERGGNSIRVGYGENVEEVLDEAERHGLSVLQGLPVQAERDGFDYGDGEAVRDQRERIRRIVERHGDHPALLAWAVGNELDHVPGRETYDRRVWDAVDDLATTIHEIDPDHPAMTVVGTGNRPKLADLVERCPELDLLGVNAYADVGEVPDWLREHGWDGPYAVTEWGPSGHWQRPETEWGVAIEETSTEKARRYRERYESVIDADPWCVGSYAFLWTSDRQEHTHTWYNTFHDDGSEKGAVETMQYLWTGEWPENRCPELHALEIDGEDAFADVDLAPGSEHTARVDATDPDGDDLDVEWELLPEVEAFADYAGHGETKPDPVEGALGERREDGRAVALRAPDDPGNYRLFAYVRDGHGKVAVGNVPFHVGE